MITNNKGAKVFLKILKLLVHGPMEKKSVFEKLQPLDIRQFNRILERMRKREQIQTRKYPDPDNLNKKITVLILKHAGADKVCNEFCIDRGRVRVSTPQLSHLSHEFGLADILRHVNAEADRGIYEIISVKDDAILKRERMALKGKISNGIYFPDFLIEIRKEGSKRNFLIEFDHGQKGGRYWTEKIRYLSYNPVELYKEQILILIALKKERLELLRRYTYKEDLYAFTRVFFITLEEFLEKGLNDVIEVIGRFPEVAIYNYSTRDYWKF